MNENKPVVSICCIAYNQEKYIRDAIEGFLLQKVSFPIEIIINDDCSTDNTANIICGYAEKYPGLVKPIFQKENQYSKGKKMFPITFARAKGKYIACCEGDDYWTDPNKLQRQFDFLETYQEYMMVTENAIVDNLKNGSKNKFSELPERDIYILDLLEKRQFATASVMFRNLGEKIMPIGDGTTIDTIMWCHFSKLGKIRYLENLSSVYRRHHEGETGGDLIEWTKKTVGWNQTLRENHPEIDKSVFKRNNLNQFKFPIAPLIRNAQYKKALITIEELINETGKPEEYREEIYQFVEELLLEKDNSWSSKIGRAITKPVIILIQLKNRLLNSMGKILYR